MLAKAVERSPASGLPRGECGFAVVIAEAPKIAPHREAMRKTIARLLGISVSDVQVKGKTNEGLDAIGRGEAIAAQAVVLVVTMTLRIHNTLTGRVEPFHADRTRTEIRMYVCGITPYDVCHVGHARCYVVFDIIRRVLKANGYKVRCVQNFTDVDDKIIARAKERGIPPSELVRVNIEDFFSKMDALGVQRADVYPKVTEHIPDIVALIKKLVDQQGGLSAGRRRLFFREKISALRKTLQTAAG